MSRVVTARDQRLTLPSAATDGAVPAALVALSQYLVGDSTMSETLRRITEITRSALPRADHASISMTVDGRIAAHSYADMQVLAVDRSQYESGNGPCIDTLINGTVTVVPCTRNDGPYPAFREAARSVGISSAMCVPMLAGSDVVGVITLYSETEDAFSPDDVELALRFAAQAAFIVLNAQAYWNARTLSENLAQAMQSRAEIEQAKGIIMANSGLSADDAFAQLVKQSQHQNVKVRELAMEIVRHSQRGRGQ